MDISEIKTNPKLSPRQKKPLPESISEQQSFIYFYFLFQQKNFHCPFSNGFCFNEIQTTIDNASGNGYNLYQIDNTLLPELCQKPKAQLLIDFRQNRPRQFL